MYDLKISGGDLLTMKGEGLGYVESGAVAINDGKLIAVGSRDEVDAVGEPKDIIDATGCLLMPGLIDVHLHSPATLARGLAQEVSTWMGSAYGPLMRHMNPDHAPVFTMIALMEGVANGTTTFGDYAASMSELLQSHDAMGNRAVVCQGINEINWSNREQWASQGWKPGMPAILDPQIGEATLAGEIELHEQWHGHNDGRIRTIFGPQASDMLSEAMLIRAQREARNRNVPIHIHVAQDPRENNATMARAGLRSIPYLDSIGLLDRDTIAVHLSTATDEEVDLVAKRNCRMACCTNSIGIIDGVVPPARAYRDLGGVVGLGSDQSAGNNSHNMFAEMRATAMFAKVKAEDPEVMPAWQVLRMATIDGARVLGIDDLTGSLTVGKEADLIMIHLRKPPMFPVVRRPARNLAANLVYAETGANVVLTMVAGEVIYRDGMFSRIDVGSWRERADAAVREFEVRVAGDSAVSTLPIVEMTNTGLI